MPCQNSGVCTDGDNTYTCACVTGFTGTDCETSNYKQIRFVFWMFCPICLLFFGKAVLILPSLFIVLLRIELNNMADET